MQKEPSLDQAQPKGNVLRLVVLLAGGLIFFLLLFADKTNLNNQPGKDIATGVSNAPQADGVGTTTGKLPPLASDPQLDNWIAQLEGSEGETKGSLLDSVIARLEARNRFAYAAQYAEDKLSQDRSLPSLLRAGRLYQKASQLDYVRADSSLFRQSLQKAETYLEEVVASEPSNEEALLYLGLVHVEGPAPMKGIMTLRKVLSLNPDNVEAIFQLGQLSIRSNQFEKAAERFQRVLELAPNNYAAKYGLAYARINLDETDGVRELLEEVVKGAKDPALKQSAKTLISQLDS